MFGKRHFEILPEDRVKLPVLFGVMPGQYLAVTYAFILLCALFLVFVLPGIVNPGARGVAVSEPLGAAVRVDGITLGTSPCEVFLPKGKRTIEFVLPGFESYTEEITVKGRVFFSLFVPQKISLSAELFCPDPVSAFALEAGDYAFWSLAGEASEIYQAPLSLSEGAYRTGPAAAGDPAMREGIGAIIAGALRFAVTRAAVRDLLRANFLAGNGGLSPSPLTLTASLQNAAAALAAAPPGELRRWLAGFSGGETSAETGNGMENDAVFQAHAAIRSRTDGGPGAGFSLNGHDFFPVPAGTISVYGQDREVPAMYLAAGETSENSFLAFIAETPRWAAENRDTLIAAGLVSMDYLLPVDNSAYPFPAVPGVSWYAARAYCAWLTSKLPPALSGWVVRLPGESEWEYAALYCDGRPAAPSLLGGLWEWCADPYAPLDFFPVDAQAAAAAGSPERSVRGGSWANPPGSVNIRTRGSLPPDSSSPFTGFRPMIVPAAGRREG